MSGLAAWSGRCSRLTLCVAFVLGVIGCVPKPHQQLDEADPGKPEGLAAGGDGFNPDSYRRDPSQGQPAGPGTGGEGLNTQVPNRKKADPRPAAANSGADDTPSPVSPAPVAPPADRRVVEAGTVLEIAFDQDLRVQDLTPGARVAGRLRSPLADSDGLLADLDTPVEVEVAEVANGGNGQPSYFFLRLLRVGIGGGAPQSLIAFSDTVASDSKISAGRVVGGAAAGAAAGALAARFLSKGKNKDTKGAIIGGIAGGLAGAASPKNQPALLRANTSLRFTTLQRGVVKLAP